jgi:uncharacterized membrane protein YhhN
MTQPGMTTVAWVLLTLAAIAAVADWIAVAQRLRTVEYVCKPLTLALVIGVALALHPVDGLRRAYVVAALVLSLAGDVFLMLPAGRKDEPTAGAAGRVESRPASTPTTPRFDPFLAGLGCFLVAHIDYVAAFRVGGPGLDRVALALLVVAPIALPLGTVIARALAASGQGAMRAPVIAYIAVISAMTASAVATGSLLATAGAWLFLASDALIAWNRFLRPLRWAPLAVIVTYHAAQVLLTVSLTR